MLQHTTDIPPFSGSAAHHRSASTVMLLSRPAGLTRRQRLLKRLVDIVVASIGLLLTLPFMLLIALAIKLESRGPVLFRQRRVGEGGVLFHIYKFRSMVVNAEALQSALNEVRADGSTIHKHRHDPRVTRIGRFIRRTSLDEMPQLLNVLLGSMSMVGPRPELPWLVEQYESWQRERFLVPQGITGWWQVTGRSSKPCHLSTEDDLHYVRNYSIWLDIRIMLMTIPALIKGDGAF
jgi:exopolysaccharide biosynthesis polyprenyl glycosylphosphotransferase